MVSIKYRTIYFDSIDAILNQDDNQDYILHIQKDY